MLHLSDNNITDKGARAFNVLNTKRAKQIHITLYSLLQHHALRTVTIWGRVHSHLTKVKHTDNFMTDAEKLRLIQHMGAVNDQEEEEETEPSEDDKETHREEETGGAHESRTVQLTTSRPPAYMTVHSPKGAPRSH